ncbi:non-classical arabinogalactan protein 31-like [Actinidia eriantha]|uniref:non-classical arabinogalactan protein 31-like n=1 Tax=Actinidia eriantha TaxID=165200 RepID=UPI002589B4A2|nr:non-classical arabinogalactan protein 31-like [Actinidia eriantha]
MDLKLVPFVLASFLLVTARAPTQSPVKAPDLAPTPAPAEVPVLTLILLHTPLVEAPTPILPAKPPVLPALHIKVSSPTKPTMRLELMQRGSVKKKRT